MSDCVFCKIVQKQLPASFVYEDTFCLAFMDLHPISDGHVLVVPKQHCARFAQLPAETAGHLLKIAQRILKAIESTAIRCEAANLFLSDGSAAGQDVMHSHLHIVPRFLGDGLKMGFSHTDPEEATRRRLDEISKKISDIGWESDDDIDADI